LPHIQVAIDDIAKVRPDVSGWPQPICSRCGFLMR